MALLILPNDYPVQNLESSESVIAYMVLIFCFYAILATMEIYYRNIIGMKDEEITKLRLGADNTIR